MWFGKADREQLIWPWTTLADFWDYVLSKNVKIRWIANEKLTAVARKIRLEDKGVAATVGRPTSVAVITSKISKQLGSFLMAWPPYRDP